MTKKIFIAGLMVVLLFAGSAFLRPSKNTSVAPTFGDIISEAQAASSDYFLKLDGIPGESTDSKHKGEIQVESWSWGATQMGTSDTTGGNATGKVQMQDFHFTSRVDKATPKLMLALANGEHIRDAVLTTRSGSGKNAREFLTITFHDVMVSSYQTSGTSGDLPKGSISMNYQKITWTYKAQNGTVTTGGWDLATNKKL